MDCRICFAGIIAGAAKFNGSKTEQIVDSTPLNVLGLFKSMALNPKVSSLVFHFTPKARSTGRSRS